MPEILGIISVVLLVAVVAMQAVLLKRKTAVDPAPFKGSFDAVTAAQERTERAVREEIARNREEAGAQAKGLRDEVAERVRGFNDSVVKQMTDLAAIQKGQLESFSAALALMSDSSAKRLEALRQTIDDRLKSFTDDSGKRSDAARAEAGQQSKQMRDDTSNALKNFNDSVIKSVAEMARDQKERFESFKMELTKLTESNEKKLAEMRATVELKMTELQTQNATKLDEMRQTVDEKLQGALEKRLGESFTLVSERLEQVHKGLGEMQNLASGVGDLKRVLTNVTTRGTWGEWRLQAILEQLLTPEQYVTDAVTKEGTGERVEYAIKYPGRGGDGKPVLLPIDSKFPKEDYERLLAAEEAADPEAVAAARDALDRAVFSSAKTICGKYLNPPVTTDFGIMFLPIEGLYAEVVRRPALLEKIQNQCRIVVAGPTTLAALLNSLQMGFRTLAIEKRSSEVWSVLGGVKTEFEKFGDVIDNVQKKLKAASETMEKEVGVRTRAITRKLRDVQELPATTEPKTLLDAVATPEEAVEAEA